MLIPSALVARGDETVTPPSCKPFTLHSNVCVGDLVAILACSIAGIGFVFWAIHAVRKMREFPFTYKSEEDKQEPDGENDRVDPFHVPSAFDNSLLVQRGVVRTPSPPERVRTRMSLTYPEEDFYRISAPISTVSTDYAQGSMTAPRMPPRAGGQTQRTSSRRHGSLSRGGPCGEGYDYGVNTEYVRNGGPSRARGSPVDMSSDDHRYRRPMRRMNVDPAGMTYAY